MATQPPRQVAPLGSGGHTQGGQAAPQHYVAPTARDLRAQSVHRLQVGLFGLAAMLLLVGLANIIMDRARMADASAVSAGASASPAASPAQADPLADIGVVPAATPSDAATAAASSGTPGN